MPRWVRLVVRLPVLLDELREGKATVSSGSSGVERGGGNWMLVRSGSEPPVLCAAGSREGFNSWSGDGNILKDKILIRREESFCHITLQLSCSYDIMWSLSSNLSNQFSILSKCGEAKGWKWLISETPLFFSNLCWGFYMCSTDQAAGKDWEVT